MVWHWARGTKSGQMAGGGFFGQRSFIICPGNLIRCWLKLDNPYKIPIIGAANCKAL